MAVFLLDRTLLRVSGPDARSFLQNLLTQDLDPLDEAGVLYAGLLSPQGKVLADMFVWTSPDGALLDTDPKFGADLLRRLTMFKLRAAVTLDDVSAELAVLADLDGREGLPDPRQAALGSRRIVPRAEAAGAATDVAPLEARRLALGVPDLARDAAPEEVFALEALFEELHGVDFKKGCFVGQENVSRMKRRATTRKKFCPVVFDGPAPAALTPVRAGAAELGSVRTGAAGRALALLRLDRAHEAIAAGTPLTAGDCVVTLDPPSWLLRPAAAED